MELDLAIGPGLFPVPQDSAESDFDRCSCGIGCQSGACCCHLNAPELSCVSDGTLQHSNTNGQGYADPSGRTADSLSALADAAIQLTEGNHIAELGYGAADSTETRPALQSEYSSGLSASLEAQLLQGKVSPVRALLSCLPCLYLTPCRLTSPLMHRESRLTTAAAHRLTQNSAAAASCS